MASVRIGDDVEVRPKRTLLKAPRRVRRRPSRTTDAHDLHQAPKAANSLGYASDLLVSITAPMNPAVLRAIAAIEEAACHPIRYPNAIWDEQEQRLVSDAQVAEVPFTAFTSRTKAEHVDGRLIVRRVKRLNPASVPPNQAGQGVQGELFATYRHHAIFTDTTLSMLQAETTHRGHAIIEQAHADLKAGPLAHLPASFSANGAWLVLAAIAFNPGGRRDHLGVPPRPPPPPSAHT